MLKTRQILVFLHPPNLLFLSVLNQAPNTRKNRKTDLLLLLGSLLIYFGYFYPILLSPNSVLSSITLDSLKNYYTFAFHIKNDSNWLEFCGMNYPYGEHIVYTDCQPIFTFLLKLLPFTHSHVIGIMHCFLFFSFIITPLILLRIFRHFKLDDLTGALVALGITLLSPQFQKINAGHHALAYGFVIPLAFLLLLDYLKNKNNKTFVLLFSYNCLLFLLHPYHGFSVSLFTLGGMIVNDIITREAGNNWNKLLKAFALGIFPMILFKVFMSATDQHENRTTEPYGGPTMTENIDTLLAPVYGPFKNTLQSIFSNPTSHFEGHSYLGFFVIVLLLVFLVSLCVRFKKIAFKKEGLIILLPSLLLLFIAFGWHHTLLNVLNIKSAALNQFRATCRFSWFFYFALPVFLTTTLYHSYNFNGVRRIAAVLFLVFSFWEGHYFFKMDEGSFWKFRNVFNAKQLNEEERTVLQEIKNIAPQALLPLPLFHGGSEMYDRPGSNNSMIPSMIYSFHSGVPILSGLMSRTSITETEDYLQLLNFYKETKPAKEFLSDKDFLILKTKDPLLPAEEILAKKVNYFLRNDSLSIGKLPLKTLLERPTIEGAFHYDHSKLYAADSSEFVFIPTLPQKPFTSANMKDYEKIFVLDSHLVKSGKYVVSLRFHYQEKIYRTLSCNLIITRGYGSYYNWDHNVNIRYLSGFYKGYGIFEYQLLLDSASRYEFLLGGTEDQTYYISDFMIRPFERTVVTTEGKDTIINNYPVKAP